ncbi:RNA polymerase sigma-70 factor (ECF subfamily) [Mycetocola sp. BIGb0189]|nr:RNA polymerase sigma-70 factor (ECF subfamily) [Mycetocola sp. BIGb0189]
MAFRMLGTVSDAEDAVQEAFIRWYRLDDHVRSSVTNPVGWFAKTTSRICLDVLKSSTRRHETYVGPWLPEPIPDSRFRVGLTVSGEDPLDRAEQGEAVSMALLTIMETMTPAERVAFVLMDVFGYSATDITEVLERSPGAIRQLASSARARLAKSERPDGPGNTALTQAFQQATLTGDVEALLHILHPEVTLRSDGGGVVRAALNPVYGAHRVARFLLGVLAKQVPTTLVPHETSTAPVLLFTHEGEVSGVLELSAGSGGIHEILIQWNPQKLDLWR